MRCMNDTSSYTLCPSCSKYSRSSVSWNISILYVTQIGSLYFVCFKNMMLAAAALPLISKRLSLSSHVAGGHISAVTTSGFFNSWAFFAWVFRLNFTLCTFTLYRHFNKCHLQSQIFNVHLADFASYYVILVSFIKFIFSKKDPIDFERGSSKAEVSPLKPKGHFFLAKTKAKQLHFKNFWH